MIENQKKILGNNIKFLRKQKRITQGELANELSVRQTTVSEWELGNAEPDSIGVLNKISKYFSVDVDALLTQDLTNNKYTPSKTSLARKINNLTDEQVQELNRKIEEMLSGK